MTTHEVISVPGERAKGPVASCMEGFQAPLKQKYGILSKLDTQIH